MRYPGLGVGRPLRHPVVGARSGRHDLDHEKHRRREPLRADALVGDDHQIGLDPLLVGQVEIDRRQEHLVAGGQAARRSTYNSPTARWWAVDGAGVITIAPPMSSYLRPSSGMASRSAIVSVRVDAMARQYASENGIAAWVHRLGWATGYLRRLRGLV